MESRAQNELQNVSRDKKLEEKDVDHSPIHKLFEYADGFDWILMAFGTLGAIVHGFTLPVFFVLFGDLLNSFGNFLGDHHKMYHEASKFASYLVYLGLVSGVSSWAEVACWMQTGERQTARLRIKYLEAMLNQDIGFFDTEARTGDLVGKISTDILIVQEAISEKMGLFLHFAAVFIGGFTVAFRSTWRLSLVTLGILPLLAIAGGLSVYALTYVTSKAKEAYAVAGNIAEQAISQIRTVYSFVGETDAVKTYSQALDSTLSLGHRAGLAKGMGVGSTYAILCGCWALLFWYGGVLVRKGEVDGGKVISGIFSVIVGGLSLGQAAPSIATFSKARTSAYQLMQLINHRPHIHGNKQNGAVLTVVEGNINFCSVSFSYPSRPDIAIFKDLCLKIPAGKTVAFVGESGSGKSTIISLIQRFYDPTSGKVLLDNHDIKTLKLDWLRQQMGLVNQEPVLFATTIEENILYGKQDATIEDIEKASKSANAHGFISQLPEGYKTQVGEHGVQLSGGQKQRIAIARAILRNPSILLLDEATSALDAESEHAVQEALVHLMIGRTTIVVAHRLSTIQNADIIAVLQQGSIVELGAHKDLMAIGDSGAYAALFKLQSMMKDEEAHEEEEHGMLKQYSSDKLSSIDGKGGSKRFRFSWRKNSLSYPSSIASDSLRIVSNDDDEEDEKESKGYFWRLLGLNLSDWPFFIVGTTGAMLAGVVTPALGFLMASNINLFYTTNFHYMEEQIAKNCYYFILVGAASFVAFLLDHYSFAIAGENLTKRVREKMLAAILNNEISWFDQSENSSGQIVSRLSSSAIYVRAAMGDRVATIVQNGTLLISALIAVYIMAWRLALVMTAIIPLVVAAAMVEQLFLKGFVGDIDKAYHKSNTTAGEAVSNIRIVAAFGAEERLVNLFANELKVSKQSNFIRGQVAGLGFGISQIFLFSSYGVALWYGAKLIRDEMASFGNVMKVFFVLFATAFAVSETISLTPDIVKSNKAMKSVFKILDRRTRIEPDCSDGEQVNEIKGDLELQKVYFYYPSRPEVVVLKNLNLKVHAGRSLALVGASGSGKSSVVSLVERFYDPTRGTVLVDGKDIRTLNLKSFRRHVGLVQQEPTLFATSIYENILYGKGNASESEVIEASKAANAHDFISSLPDGYKTNVGERGIQLSGGQKQRLAIARAVLKNPKILLLDEATSALDAESERIVQEALDRLMKGRTSIIIAHRLSTIRDADEIAVMEGGKIIEQGRHQELVGKNDGAYYRLIKLQQRST